MKLPWIFVLLSAGALAAFGQSSPRARVTSIPPAATVVPVSLPETPTAQQLKQFSALPESLSATDGEGSAAERTALAAAINQFLQRANADDFGMFENYLLAEPNSPWAHSLRLNLGHAAYRRGFFSKAFNAWRDAWNATKDGASLGARAVADSAGAEYALMLARIGRKDELAALISTLVQRGLQGSALAKLDSAREGLLAMETRPGIAFRCGPYAALNCALQQGMTPDPAWLKTVQSPPQGFSLAEVKEMASALGLGGWQMAKRAPGAAVVTPCVIHWKLDHYGALLNERNGSYVLKDPTFATEHLVTAAALNEEASGYCLIPAGALPVGWSAVTEAEGQTVFGRGHSGNSDSGETKDCSDKEGGDCGGKGMAGYRFHTMLASLTVNDIPAWYAPAWGPPINFEVNYNQREADQPTTMNWTNFGPSWECRWVAYLEDDPGQTNPPLTFHFGGGGFADITNYGPESLDRRTRAQVTKVSSAVYEYRRTDGSKLIYGRAIGTTAPRKVFLTKVIDPQGNEVTLEYDDAGGFPTRIKKIIAADGAYMELFYEQPGENFMVSKVRDPYQREALFEYETIAGKLRLKKITDPKLIESVFGYDGQGRMNTLTTPYGTTRFASGEPMKSYGLVRWVEATDPNGDKERLEYHVGTGIPAAESPENVPSAANFSAGNSDLDDRNSFYWDKKAWRLAPGDFLKARVYHWLQIDGADRSSGTLESTKLPFQNRVWFNYPNQNQGSKSLGSLPAPSAIARVIEDEGGNRVTQIARREYNSEGNVKEVIDPIGRETQMEYFEDALDPSNPRHGLDLLYVRQKNGAQLLTLAEIQYNPLFPPHLPWKVIDAAGKITTLTYNSRGQVETVTNARNETTTYIYETNPANDGYGRVKQIVGPTAGATLDFTFDPFDRVETVTDSAGHVMTYDYDELDRITKVTYPDATYEETQWTRLDPTAWRDREGRWTTAWYNALRQPIVIEDPLGQFTQFEWCLCGELQKLIDGSGNLTSWKLDEQGRVYEKVYPDNRKETFGYQPLSGRLATITDAKDQVKTMNYFPDGALQSVAYTNTVVTTPGVSFTYDAVFPRLATMTDGIGTTQYDYYGVGVVGALQVKWVDGPFSGTSDKVSYSYDDLGRIETRNIGTNGNENKLTWAFDTLGRLDFLKLNRGADPDRVFNYEFVGQTGRLGHLDFPNGMRRQFDYFGDTGDHRLKQIKTLTNPGNPASLVSQFDYTFKPDGQIETWTRQFGAAAATTFSFGYDQASQLSAATLVETATPANVIERYAYTFDAAGNRRSEQRGSLVNQWTVNNRNQLTGQTGGGKLRVAGTLDEPAKVTLASDTNPTPIAADVDSQNRFAGFVDVITGTNTLSVTATDYSPAENAGIREWEVNVTGGTAKTLTYDFNGNLTSDGTRTFTWDAEDRLKSVTVGADTWEWDYDGMSRRVREKKNTALQRQWVWCGLERCEERNASNVVTKRFYPEGEQRVGGADAGDYYYTRDHLGSLRELVDSTGAVRARYDYDPWGRRTKLAGDLDTEWSFTGHQWHAGTGLLLAPFRAFDPELGRWISPDPIAENGGINLYAYCQGDPTNFRDYLGLCDDPSELGSAATNGLGKYLGQQLGDAGAERARQDALVRALDPNDTAGRSAIKEASRSRTPRMIADIIKDRRPGTGPRPGSVGRANVPNAAASRLGAIFRVGGRALVGASLVSDAVSVATSSCKSRALVEAGFGTLGALGGGTLGALGGTALLPGVGTVAGGLTGSAAGGAAGNYVGGLLYDSLFGDW